MIRQIEYLVTDVEASLQWSRDKVSHTEKLISDQQKQLDQMQEMERRYLVLLGALRDEIQKNERLTRHQ